MNVDVVLSLPPQPGSVSVARGVMAGSLRAVGAAVDSVDDVMLGLSEACTNVIDHAKVGDDYEVHLCLEAFECTITVTDRGGAFIHASRFGRTVSGTAERGRGFLIMHAVMDRVDIFVDSDTKTIVRLVKILDIDPGGPLAHRV